MQYNLTITWLDNAQKRSKCMFSLPKLRNDIEQANRKKPLVEWCGVTACVFVAHAFRGHRLRLSNWIVNVTLFRGISSLKLENRSQKQNMHIISKRSPYK